MPPQELAPFQRRIFLRGEAGSIGSGGSTPVGGRNINCSERKGDEEDYMLMLSLSNGQFIFSEWSVHATHPVSCPREPPLERGAATGWFERLLVRQGLPPCTRDGPDIGVGLTWGEITRVSVWHQHCHHSVHHTIDHHTNRSCRQDHQYLCLCFCTFFAWGAAGRGLAASWTTPSWWRRMAWRRMTRVILARMIMTMITSLYPKYIFVSDPPPPPFTRHANRCQNATIFSSKL